MKRKTLALTTSILIAVMSFSVNAANYTWTNSAGGNWDDAGNWTEGIPVSATNTTLQFTPDATYISTNDLSGSFTNNQIQVDAGTVSLSGNKLILDGTTPSIVNNSGNLLSIGNTVDLAPTVGFSGNGPIMFTVPVVTTYGWNYALTFDTPTTFSGGLNQTHSSRTMNFYGASPVTLTGANEIIRLALATANMSVYIENGTTKLRNQEIHSGGGLMVRNNGILQAADGQVFRIAYSTSSGNPSGVGTLTVGNQGLVTVLGDSAQYVNVADRVASYAKAGTGTINLNTGGAFETARTFAADIGGSGSATATLYFDGGTLRALGDNADWIDDISITAVTVQSAGAIIDSQSYTNTIAEPLIHDAALGATADGGIVKLGTGKLTLSGINTYTGPTTVSNGILRISSDCLYTNSDVYISSPGKLQLDFTETNIVHALYINGSPKVKGLYNESLLPDYIAGTGVMDVQWPPAQATVICLQ